MRVANVIHGVSFAEVKHGNLIQFFDNNGTLHTGIKVHTAQCDGVLFLIAHSPNERGTISWVRDSINPPWGHNLLLEFPDALLHSDGFMKLPDGHRPKGGDLTIHADGTTMFLTKTSGSPLSALYVDMKTGQIAKANNAGMPPLIVSKWAIVIPTVEAGEVIVEFPERPERHA